MHCIRLTCSGIECNKEELCTVKYKILRCTRNDHKYYVYRLNKHRDDMEISSKTVHGIKNKVKDIIDNLIFEKDISLPKKIHIKLNSKKYVEGEIKLNAIDKPTLQQVQNYIKYLKTKVSDTNKVSDVKKFVEELVLSTII